MRIALICTEKLPVPPIAGGAVQLYIEGIVPYLSGTHQITIFSIQFPGLPERETRNNVRYIRVPGGSNKIYVNSLRTALDSSYDLIHVLNRPRYVLELMDTFPGTRFSLSLHNEMFHPEKLSDEEGIKCINRVEFINTVSKYIADTIANRFPIARSKLHVVYSGVDASLYTPVWSSDGLALKKKLKAIYGLQDYKVVLFVGRLSNKKGVDILLKAMDMVMRTNPKTALVVVGSKWYGKNETDDYTASLQILSKSITGRIIFTGFVPPSDIPRLYNIGDVFVCASQWNEPLARVHYEAMAAGLPIITTNRGGNAEVIQGFGNGIVLDDYSNPVAMARYISELLKNETACLKMGNIGRRLAEEKYSWKRVADEVFERLLPKDAKAGTSVQVIASPVEAALQKPASVESDIFAYGKIQAVLPGNTTPVTATKPVPIDSQTAKSTAAQAFNPAAVSTVIQNPSTAAKQSAMPSVAHKTPTASTPVKSVMPSAAQGAKQSDVISDKIPSAADAPAVDQSAMPSSASYNSKPVIKEETQQKSVSAKAPSLASFMKKPAESHTPVPSSTNVSSVSHQSDFWLSGTAISSDQQQMATKNSTASQPQSEVNKKPQTCSLADFTSGRLWNKPFK